MFIQRSMFLLVNVVLWYRWC